jgi:hypothetical protein
MSDSRFVIYTNWDPEADSAAIHAERVLESLAEFGVASPALRSWSILDRTTSKAVPIANAQAQLGAIVSRGLIAVREVNPGSNVSFSVIGAGRRSFRGVCAALFEAEFAETADPSIVAWPVFRSIMSALAPIWNATYIQAYTNEIQNFWENPRRVFDLAWITYLCDAFARQIEVPANASVEEVPGSGGLLLSAAEGNFDVCNAEHMAAARSIRDALTPLNKLYAPPWEKPPGLR